MGHGWSLHSRYLLEDGDEIIVNEGLISSALLSVINKFIPIDMFNKMDPKFQSIFAQIAQDPEKAKKLQQMYKANPGFFELLT